MSESVAKLTQRYDGLFEDEHGSTQGAVELGVSVLPQTTYNYVIKVARAQAEFDRELAMLDLPHIRAALPNKINAIKRVRDDLGIGLRDAKHFVDFVWALLL